MTGDDAYWRGSGYLHCFLIIDYKLIFISLISFFQNFFSFRYFLLIVLDSERISNKKEIFFRMLKFEFVNYK